jgi:5-methylthioadenosine/S-adenosylhomocysteine deaminase
MIVIRHGQVVDAAAHKVHAADLLVENGKIAGIGAPGLPAPANAQVIDATDRLLMPGLVNAHTHSHGNLVRSAGDKWTLELGMHLMAATRRNQTLEDKYLGALIGAVEMVSKGCTACYDLVYEAPYPTVEGLNAVAQAYADVGMRAVVTPMMASHSFYRAYPGLLEALPADMRDRFSAWNAGKDESSLETCRHALREWKFDPEQIKLAVSPTTPLHCSDSFWTGAAALAREYGAGLHSHLAESKLQAVGGLERYGCTLTEHLDNLGVLGPNFTGAHGVWLDDADLSRLADRGARLAHNPGSNMRYGSGLAAVRRMLDRGVQVGIGTDSRSCSDNLNMFEAMRLASYVSRVRGPDYRRWLSTDEVFRMATVDSAHALGFGDSIGRLAPGAHADIVFLDRRNLNYVPLNDVTNQIVNAEDGTGVDSVMIGGRMILDRGKFTTVDYNGLAAKAEKAIERMRGANAEALELANRLEPVVGSFCIALGSQPYHVHRFVQDES